MTKLVLSDLTNLQNESTAVSILNANFEAIQEAFDNTVSRDGETPNTLVAQLDLNSNKIINLPAATTATEPVRKAEFDASIGGGGGGGSAVTITGTGILSADTSETATGRTLTGTANEITVTNGTGITGNPTISIPTSLTFTGKTVTGGTFSGITLGSDIALSGNPTTTTQTVGNNTTRIATTAFVAAAVSASVTGVSTLNGQTGDIIVGYIPGGRLSLTTATPVTESDVTAAATVYLCLTDYDNTLIYDGSNFVPRAYSGELSLALDSNAGHTNYHQIGKNFDLYDYWNSSVVALGTGPAWSTDIVRGSGAGTTELEMYKGRAVNKNSIVLRIGSSSGDTTTIAARKANYRGSFRTIANGQTEDSLTKRYLFDCYRPTEKPLRKADTTDSWSYTTASFRQTNNSVTNQVEWLHGLSGRNIKLSVCGSGSGDTLVGIGAGIGIDGTADNSHFKIDNAVGNTTGALRFNAVTLAWYDGYPGLGYHYGTWLEFGGTGVTFYGDNNSTIKQTGIRGSTWQ